MNDKQFVSIATNYYTDNVMSELLVLVDLAGSEAPAYGAGNRDGTGVLPEL